MTDTEAEIMALEKMNVDWADFAIANPNEFSSHGVNNLEGPAFDKARAALTPSYPEIKLEDVSDETLKQLHKSGQLPEGRYDEEKRRRSSK